MKAEGKTNQRNPHHLAAHGTVGLVLIVIFWTVNWKMSGIRTHWAFFPLWLGYILTVDALTLLRTGTSLLKRDKRKFIGLFILSIPGWWLFEFLNMRTHNWEYIGGNYFSNTSFFLYSSLNFSTVMPAVFSTAELLGSTGVITRLRTGPKLSGNQSIRFLFLFTGIGMFALLMLFPFRFYPLMWLSVYFILEPINLWMGNRNLVSSTERGDWRPVIALFLGALMCGFFWEMWNYWSFPKWVYHTPGADFFHIFEMPLLGYGGYLPFSLELFALYHLLSGILRDKETTYLLPSFL